MTSIFCFSVIFFSSLVLVENLTIPQLCQKRGFGYKTQDPEDCHGFYVCLGNWGQFSLECERGYRFNETFQKCIKGKCPPCLCLKSSSENDSDITGYIPAVPVFWLSNQPNNTNLQTLTNLEQLVANSGKELFMKVKNQSVSIGLSLISLDLNATALKSQSNSTDLHVNLVMQQQVAGEKKNDLSMDTSSVNYKPDLKQKLNFSNRLIGRHASVKLPLRSEFSSPSTQSPESLLDLNYSNKELTTTADTPSQPSFTTTIPTAPSVTDLITETAFASTTLIPENTDETTLFPEGNTLFTTTFLDESTVKLRDKIAKQAKAFEFKRPAGRIVNEPIETTTAVATTTNLVRSEQTTSSVKEETTTTIVITSSLPDSSTLGIFDESLIRPMETYKFREKIKYLNKKKAVGRIENELIETTTAVETTTNLVRSEETTTSSNEETTTTVIGTDSIEGTSSLPDSFTLAILDESLIRPTKTYKFRAAGRIENELIETTTAIETTPNLVRSEETTTSVNEKTTTKVISTESIEGTSSLPDSSTLGILDDTLIRPTKAYKFRAAGRIENELVETTTAVETTTNLVRIEETTTSLNEETTTTIIIRENIERTSSLPDSSTLEILDENLIRPTKTYKFREKLKFLNMKKATGRIVSGSIETTTVYLQATEETTTMSHLETTTEINSDYVLMTDNMYVTTSFPDQSAKETGFVYLEGIAGKVANLIETITAIETTTTHPETTEETTTRIFLDSTQSAIEETTTEVNKLSTLPATIVLPSEKTTETFTEISTLPATGGTTEQETTTQISGTTEMETPIRTTQTTTDGATETTTLLTTELPESTTLIKDGTTTKPLLDTTTETNKDSTVTTTAEITTTLAAGERTTLAPLDTTKVETVTTTLVVTQDITTTAPLDTTTKTATETTTVANGETTTFTITTTILPLQTTTEMSTKTTTIPAQETTTATTSETATETNTETITVCNQRTTTAQIITTTLKCTTTPKRCTEKLTTTEYITQTTTSATTTKVCEKPTTTTCSSTTTATTICSTTTTQTTTTCAILSTYTTVSTRPTTTTACNQLKTKITTTTKQNSKNYLTEINKIQEEIDLNSICAQHEKVYFIKHPRECNQYYTCYKKRAYRQTCPGRFMFDEKLQICNYPEAVKCETMNSYSPQEALETHQQQQQSTLEPKPNDCRFLKSGTFIRDPDNCNKYYVCLNGEAVAHFCPRDQYFDNVGFVCNFKALVKNCRI